MHVDFGSGMEKNLVECAIAGKRKKNKCALTKTVDGRRLFKIGIVRNNFFAAKNGAEEFR
jgi:hypothetical protein